MNTAEAGVKSVLVSEKEIKSKLKETGAMLSKQYQGKNLLLVSILKGSFVFMADLMREISIPCEVDFMCASSYKKGMVSSGEINITKDLDVDISNYDVLIVEDIIDSGITLKAIRDMLLARNPKSLRICALLDKPARRNTDIKADYVCFTIPNEFVVGYGLDCAEKYRNLPYIGIFDSESIR